MSEEALIGIARTLVVCKGLLAMDESNPTCNKRFAKAGIPQTEEARLFRQGCMLYELIPTMPEQRLGLLMEGFADAVSATGFFATAIQAAK